MPLFRHSAAFLTVKLLLWVPTSPAVQAVEAIQVTQLSTPALTESSGVAIDVFGKIWTHNDSGDSARLFRFDNSNGNLLGEYAIESVTAIDWEDLCVFKTGGKELFLVADVGDNLRRRKTVQVHFVMPSFTPSGSCQGTEHVATANVRYADGPVNCEAVCFDPVTQQILLPSKEPTRSRIYAFEAKEILTKIFAAHEASPRRMKTRIRLEFSVTAKRIGWTPIPLVTGGDISADGKHLVLCTYGPGAWIDRKDNSESWDFNSPKLFRLPFRKQGEAVGFTRDGTQLMLTSEFAPTPLSSLVVSEIEFAQ